MGARAYYLMRLCTALIDGTPRSGLKYEVGKKLALSGVGAIVLVSEDDDDDGDDDDGGGRSTATKATGMGTMRFVHGAYHDVEMKNLGVAYWGAAEREVWRRGRRRRQ